MTTLKTCGNGGCTRPIYRGRVCFRCWAGIKWTSIVQRVENKNGNNNSYRGVPITFTREQFIEWVLCNPPPKELVEPSIDRVENNIGYAPGNIQWLEKRFNSRKINKNLPITHQRCSRCGLEKPATTLYFYSNKSKSIGVSSYCKSCDAAYKTEWNRSHHG